MFAPFHSERSFNPDRTVLQRWRGNSAHAKNSDLQKDLKGALPLNVHMQYQMMEVGPGANLKST